MPKLNMPGGAGPRAVAVGLLFFAWGTLRAEPTVALRTPKISACADALSASPVVKLNDEQKLKTFCDQHDLTLELMAPAPGALAYRPRMGFRAKPSELKNCGSLKRGPNAGLVACPPELFASHALWYEEMQNLAQQGFYVMGGQDYLVSDAKGWLFFSDYDLLGVFDAAGHDVYNEDLRRELNQLFGRDLVMHGPLSQYALRKQVGLKLPVRIFTAGETPITAHSVEDLHKLEDERHIPWVW